MMRIANSFGSWSARALGRLALPIALAALGADLNPASADLVDGSGNSTGYSVYTSLSAAVTVPIVGTTTLTAVTPTPLGQSSGIAPSTYSQSVSGPLSLTSGILLNLSTTAGTNSSATSTVDLTAGSKSTTASDTVAGLSAGILSTLNFLSVGATTLSSSAGVTGVPGAFGTSGAVNIQGLAINVLGVNVLAGLSPGSYTGNVAANTLINVSGIAGLTGTIQITLNAEHALGNGTTSAGISVDALNIQFLGVGIDVGTTHVNLSGGMIMSHSDATMTAVPLPPSLTLFGSGLAGISGFAALRRRPSGAAIEDSIAG